MPGTGEAAVLGSRARTSASQACGPMSFILAVTIREYMKAARSPRARIRRRAKTIIEIAKLSGHDPEAYLADIVARIGDHKINRLGELLPWNGVPLAQEAKAVA